MYKRYLFHDFSRCLVTLVVVKLSYCIKCKNNWSFDLLFRICIATRNSKPLPWLSSIHVRLAVCKVFSLFILFDNWRASRENRPYKAFVVVIPKEGWWRPSFFWYDTDVWHHRLYSRKFGVMGVAMCGHPSFGMTTTKTLRFVFSWCTSIIKVTMNLQELCEMFESVF